MRPGHLGGPPGPHQGQRDLELGSEQTEGVGDAGLTPGGERPENRPADEDGPGAQGKRDGRGRNPDRSRATFPE